MPPHRPARIPEASPPADRAPATGALAVVAMEVVHPGPNWEAVVATPPADSPEPRMDVHQNARTTLHGRCLMIHRLADGWTVAEVAAAFGVTLKTVRKWRDRHASDGEPGLVDRSSRPHHSPTRLSDAAADEIEQLRRQRLSAPAIARKLGRPVSTVGLVLRRRGLGRLAALDPKLEPIRYQRDRPGELIHLDVKKLGKIDGVGHRITGDRTRRSRGVGWDFLHVCVDDASRLAYTEILARRAQRERGGVPRAGLGLVCQPRRRRRARDDRQRLRLPQPPLPPGDRCRRAQAQAHQTLHAPHQWQGGALHSDEPARMGLPASLRKLDRTRPSHAPLAPRLQPLITTHISLYR